MLHWTSLEILAKEKHSNLLVPFVSYEENEVLVRRGITIVIVLLILVVPGFHFHFILSICMVSHSSITDLCFTTLNATMKEGRIGRQREREGQRGRET